MTSPWHNTVAGLVLAGVALGTQASPLGRPGPVAYAYPHQTHRLAYYRPAYPYVYPAPRAAWRRNYRSPVAAAPARTATKPASEQVRPPAVHDVATANPPPAAGVEAALDLLAALDYPLEPSARVPRVEVPELPGAYHDIADPEQRREAFLRILLPLVLMENEHIRSVRRRMLSLLAQVEAGEPLASDEQTWLEKLARRYRVSEIPASSADARMAIRRRVDTLPPSLSLAQAANESAWGRSRFAREARNLFGIWTYDEKLGIVPKRREPGKKHLVRKFGDLRESVRVYMHTLNSHPAYADLRAIRAQLRQENRPLSGMQVAAGLERYSAQGKRYVRLIQEIIARHDLETLNRLRLAG